MNITTKFDLGQTVYAIHQGFETLRDECPLCGDTDAVTLTTGQRVMCPERYGNGHRSVIQRWWPWVLWRSGTVGQVRVELVDPKYGYDDDAESVKRRRQYMLAETGVGTGSLYNECDLFASKEEAEAACTALNAEDAACQPAPAWNGPNACKACRARAGGTHKATCQYALAIKAKMEARAKAAVVAEHTLPEAKEPAV